MVICSILPPPLLPGTGLHMVITTCFRRFRGCLIMRDHKPPSDRAACRPSGDTASSSSLSLSSSSCGSCGSASETTGRVASSVSCCSSVRCSSPLPLLDALPDAGPSSGGSADGPFLPPISSLSCCSRRALRLPSLSSSSPSRRADRRSSLVPSSRSSQSTSGLGGTSVPLERSAALWSGCSKPRSTGGAIDGRGPRRITTKENFSSW
mmetsp:Transcript_12651/g.35591  ORF Transcript_12651/g.35591 Transcript_12651/m.35591 type:complete len:208 (+) Transcript_12651:483-1106(+)